MRVSVGWSLNNQREHTFPSLSCRICLLQEAVPKKYFSGTNMRKDAMILSTNQLRQSLHNVRSELFKIIHSLLVSAGSREKTLEYIAEVLSRNQKRSRIQVEC